MAGYIEPQPISGYVQALYSQKMSFLKRFIWGWGEPGASERVGPNFTFFIADKPIVQDADCDIPAADKNNTMRTGTAVDKVARTCLTQSEYNAFLRMRGAREAHVNAHLDAIQQTAEIGLDAVLATSTNTLSLGTDNVLTRKNMARAIALVNKNGGRRKDMVLWTSSEELVSELFDSGISSVPSALTDLAGMEDVIGFFDGNIPIVITPNATNSTATSGVAAYLWARDGVLGGFDPWQTRGPVEFFGSYNIYSNMSFGYALRDGVADKRVVKFINP